MLWISEKWRTNRIKNVKSKHFKNSWKNVAQTKMNELTLSKRWNSIYVLENLCHEYKMNNYLHSTMNGNQFESVRVFARLQCVGYMVYRYRIIFAINIFSHTAAWTNVVIFCYWNHNRCHCWCFSCSCRCSSRNLSHSMVHEHFINRKFSIFIEFSALTAKRSKLNFVKINIKQRQQKVIADAAAKFTCRQKYWHHIYNNNKLTLVCSLPTTMPAHLSEAEELFH